MAYLKSQAIKMDKKTGKKTAVGPVTFVPVKRVNSLQLSEVPGPGVKKPIKRVKQAPKPTIRKTIRKKKTGSV